MRVGLGELGGGSGSGPGTCALGDLNQAVTVEMGKWALLGHVLLAELKEPEDWIRGIREKKESVVTPRLLALNKSSGGWSGRWCYLGG